MTRSSDMNINEPDDFEGRLGRVPLRAVPAQWRSEILRAASGATFAARPVPRPSLAQMLTRLLWPSPRAWAGLAAVWLVLAGVNLTTRGAPSVIASAVPSTAPEIRMALEEQQRLAAELRGDLQPEPGSAQQPSRSRSARTPQLLHA